MRELVAMLGLSILLAVAAFAQAQRSFPTSSDSTLTSVPKSLGTFTGTATSVSTTTETRPSSVFPTGSIPTTPPKMPEEPTKPSGFR